MRDLAAFTIVDIDCGANHVIALSDTGVIFQWGGGEQGQLGRRVLERHALRATEPRELWLPGVRVIGAGSYTSFAYTNDGTLYAWGLNDYQQTGVDPEDGGLATNIFHPTPVRALSGTDKPPVVQICGGHHHTLALLENGEVWAWGRGDSSQIGVPLDKVRQLNRQLIEKRGDDEEQASAHGLAVAWPQRISAFNRPVCWISAGGNHNLAVDAQAVAYSWGHGGSLQLGSGEEEDIEVPTPVTSQQLRYRGALLAAGGDRHSVFLARRLEMMPGRRAATKRAAGDTGRGRKRHRLSRCNAMLLGQAR